MLSPKQIAKTSPLTVYMLITAVSLSAAIHDFTSHPGFAAACAGLASFTILSAICYTLYECAGIIGEAIQKANNRSAPESILPKGDAE